MENLDKYIEELKKQDSLMSLEEVDALIGNTTALPKSNRTRLYFLIGSGVMGTILLLAIFLNRTNTKELTDPKQNEHLSDTQDQPSKSTVITSSNLPNELTSEKTDSDHLISQITESQSFDPDLPTSMRSSVNSINFNPVNTPLTPVIKTDSHLIPFVETDHSSSAFTTSENNRFIVLSKEELEKFHLYYHDDMLLYSNKDIHNEGLEIWVGRYSSINVLRSGKYMADTILRDYPLYVSSPYMEYFKTYKTEIKNVQWSDYLPIRIDFDLGYSEYTVWWFHKNEENIARLPERYRSSFNNYSVSRDSVYAQKKPNYKYKRPEFIPDSFLFNTIQVIEPNDKLLKKMHIESSAEQIKYRKKFQHYTMIPSGAYSDVMLKYSSKIMANTPPSFITTRDSVKLSIQEFNSSNLKATNSVQFFYANKHNMIALKVGEVNGREVIFWYENKKKLLKSVDEETRNQLVSYLAFVDSVYVATAFSKNADRSSTVLSKFKSFQQLDASVVPFVTLSPEQLAALNIVTDSNQITFILPGNGPYSVKYSFKKEFTLTQINKNSDTEPHIKPLFITDIYGNLRRLQLASPEKIHIANLQRLIPVYAGTSEEYHLSDYVNANFHPDCIFWFEPTEEFLSTLPDSVSDQIRYELQVMDAIETSSPEAVRMDSSDSRACKYLNPCEEIGGNMSLIQVHPNPTSGVLIFSADSTWDQSVVIIQNLSGQMLLRYSYSSNEKLTIDLSTFPSGIYLVTAVLKDGRKVTRKVVKQ